MLHYDHNGIRVYFGPVDPAEPGGGNRGCRERRAVGALLGEAFPGLATPRVEHSPSGAPYLPDVDAEISITHCRSHAALAVGPRGRAVGIDLETADRSGQLLRVSHKYLTAEQASCGSLLRAWCTKEALYKAALTPGLPLVDIPLPPGGCGEVQLVGRRFAVMELDGLPDGLAGVLAVAL